MAASTETMRIAHIDAERGFSGGEVQVLLLIEGLRQRGHANVLLCPPASAVEGEADRRGIATRAVGMRNDADAVAVWRLVRELRRWRPQLVHLHTGRATWLGGLAAWLARVPAVTTRRMDRPVRRGWRTRLIYRHLTQRVAAISPAVAACLVAGGVSAEGITVVCDGVDPQRLRRSRERQAVRESLATRPGELVVLVVAALIPRKGVDVLLDAVARLRAGGVPPTVWIAGEGPERRRLEDQRVRLGLSPHVRLLGQRDDVADLLGACDVFVIPSRREGMGVAALEAMAAGRPVVATAVGGLQEAVVEGVTGRLVPPDDSAALAQAIGGLLADADGRRRLGEAGAERIRRKFLAEHMVTAYLGLYRSLLGEWQEGRRP